MKLDLHKSSSMRIQITRQAFLVTISKGEKSTSLPLNRKEISFLYFPRLLEGSRKLFHCLKNQLRYLSEFFFFLDRELSLYLIIWTVIIYFYIDNILVAIFSNFHLGKNNTPILDMRSVRRFSFFQLPFFLHIKGLLGTIT